MRGSCRCRNGGKKTLREAGLSLKKGGTQPLNARKSFVSSRNSSPTTRLMRASIAGLPASYRLCHCALLLRVQFQSLSPFHVTSRRCSLASEFLRLSTETTPNTFQNLKRPTAKGRERMARYSVFTLSALTLLCLGASSSAPTIAQQGITRTPLGTMDFPAGYQTVMGVAQIPAGVCADRHTHPGVETSYVLEGEGVLKVEGKPEQRLKAGEPLQIPANAPHSPCATTALKILTVHVVEKGKPLASPAP